MHTIEYRISTPWKNNDTAEAHKIIDNHIEKIGIEAALNSKKNFGDRQIEVESRYSSVKTYGIFGTKKKIKTSMKINFD